MDVNEESKAIAVKGFDHKIELEILEKAVSIPKDLKGAKDITNLVHEASAQIEYAEGNEFL